MVVASDGEPRVALRQPPWRAFSATRAALLGLLPLLFLVGFSGTVFFSGLSGGPIFYGLDTTTFYYPLTLWAADELKAGRLPLWTPLIFGGYPIFADGEIGLLSPFQALLLATLEMPLAYSAMRAIDYVIAALGLYLYARTLGANGLGATVGALAFAYGSFMVGHLQHDNILRSASWLPWLLLAAEHALRATGPRRPGWIAVAALMLAFQGVGVHIQPLLMSLMIFGLALLFGPFGRTSIPTIQSPGVSGAAALGRLVYDVKLLLSRKRLAGTSLDWFIGRFLLGLAVVGLGLGMAAAQLVPLYQLGLRSLRPALVTYDYATSFAVSPPQILTLVFPAMFNFDAERHWALWAPHETTLYVGVAPLLLAVLGLAFVRGRAVTFFGLVGLVSLILVFGDYLPVKPYTVVWNMPGFAYLRAPARFSLLLTLALAMLAALGTTWLMRHARYRGSSRPLDIIVSAMLVLPIVLAVTIGAVGWWLRFDPIRAIDLFGLLLQTSKESWQLGPWHVYYGLSEMTRPDNPRTALGLGLLLVIPLLLRAWLARPRFEAVWGALLLLLTATDLWIFSTSFYFRANPEALIPNSPPIAYLRGQQPPFRVFVEPTLNNRYGANQLAGAGIETINGYSSLEPPRFSDYWWSIVHQDNFLLDQFDAQYVLAARQSPGSRTYEGVTFHPIDRLMSGTAANPSGTETFRMPATQVTALTLISAIEGLGEVPSGTTVAEVTLLGVDGSRQVVPVRGGVDVAEYRAAEPGWPMADYVGPRVVWAGPEFVPMHVRPADPVRLYGSTVPLAQPFEAVAVEVRMVSSVGRLHLHGLGLQSAENTIVSVRTFDKVKYQPLYADERSALLQNTAARPRVSVVGQVLAADGPTTAARLHELPFDPAQQAIVEGLPPDAVAQGGAEGASCTDAGAVCEVQLLEYEPERIVVQADLSVPGYVILADRYDEGWRAYVDDVEVPIARANGVERLVAVPAGSHMVRFSYAPIAVSLGLGISAFACLAWLGLLIAAPVMAIRARRRSSRVG